MNPQPSQENLFNPTNGNGNYDSFMPDDFQHYSASLRQKEEKQIGGLTSSQIYSFRSQILAYKYLIRNLSLPQCVGPNTPSQYIWEAQKEQLRKKSILFYKQKVEKEQELRQKMIIKMKPQQLENQMKDQEKTAFLVEKRKQDILNILEKDKNQKLTPQFKQRLQIELHFLDCRQDYLDLFHTLVQGIKKNRQSTFLFHRELLDRNYFRIQKNTKSQGIKSQNTDKILIGDQQRKKKLKHLQFMRHLKTHRNNFFVFHQNIAKNHKKINLQLDITFKNKKKLQDDKKQQKDRELKQAMQVALKQNDMTEFFRIQSLLKSSKIHELLEKTNQYLKDLGAKVMLQKGENDEKNVPVQLEINDGDNENIQDTFNNANKYYYSLTHTVKEKISQQSNLVVGGKLKEYQLTGVQWMLSLYNNNLNGILADEMGLGKTIQTIALLCHLVQVKKNFGPFLIVLPLSTLSNWKLQFHKWSPSLKVVVYRGNKTQRSQVTRIMKTNKWNVCLTTYEYILKDRKNLSKYDWKYIIVDEGHKMKNSKSKFVNVLGQQYSSCHRLLLTGTPLQNNLGQLWSLLNFLLPKVFNSCDDFSQWFAMAMNKKTSSQNTELELSKGQKMLIINRLQQVLRPFLLRRVKKQVLKQLPEKVQYVIKIPLSAWQKYIYNSVTDKNRMQLNGKSGKIRTTSLTNTLIQLRKCCNHPYLFLHDLYGQIQPQWVITASGKMEVLDRILPKLMNFGHKVLIFTQMTRVLDVLTVYFNYKYIKFLRLDGSTKSQQRAKITELFNSPHSDYSIFILSTRAGGLGLNLQAADTVIIFDSDWNPQMDLQAQDRAHRLGQQNKVVVLRFITNMPVEQNMYETSLEKKNIDEVLIQGGLYNLKSNEDQRRKKLEDALKLTQILDEKKNSQIHNSHSINKMIARNDEEFKTFQEMDEQYRKNYEDQGKSRLMTDEQIPKWFLENQDKAEIKQYGRGNRVHNSITYYDDQRIYQELLGQKIYQQDSKQQQEPIDEIIEDQPEPKL